MNISIALCTYNGARFLRTQLDSINAQSRLPDELVVCDDGSSDGTIEILKNFSTQAKFPVRIYENEKNLGVVANFLKAIALCNGELIALADQDDIWNPDKLADAERMLLETGDCANSLYCSRLEYIDTNGIPIKLSVIPKHIEFDNAIVENIATGCSVVFGAGIRKRMLLSDPAAMLMHDWWGYLIATAFGQVVYDKTPQVQYRQHVDNVAGWLPRSKKIRHRTRSLFARLRSGKTGMDSLNQAARFVQTHADLPASHRDTVQKLLMLRQVGFFKRLNYVLGPDIHRNDFIENFGLRIMILMGWH